MCIFSALGVAVGGKPTAMMPSGAMVMTWERESEREQETETECPAWRFNYPRNWPDTIMLLLS